MIRITKSNLRRFLVGLLATPVLAFAADPQIAAFNDSPDPAIAGQVYSYEIRVDNNASDAAANTRLTVTVATGASFVSASPLSQNCAPVSATQVECDLGTLGANGGDVRIITMNWRATVAGLATINATASVSTTSAGDNPANNTQLANTTVNQGANLALTMTDSPDPVSPGSNVTYVLTASNQGPNAVGDLTVINNLPPSGTFVSATGSGWSCSHSAGTVTCTRSGPHNVGVAIPSISIVATATASSGSITNGASVSTGPGGVPDPDGSDNIATATTTISSGADLQVTSKAVTSATPLTAGTNVTFRLTPRNAGPDAASSVSVTDVLPAGWSFVSASGTNWSCSAAGQTVTCTRASMPVGASDDIDIVATAPASVAEAGSPYTNTGSIGAATADPLPGNNGASVTVTVYRDGADLSLGKVKTPFAVSVGGTLTSTITVTNNGPRVATGPLRVVEVLTNEAYVSGSGTGWTCAAFSANVIVCDHANAGGLAVGASLPALTITTTAIAAGSAVNTACTGSSLPPGVVGPTASPPNNIGGDPNTTNDCFTSNSVGVVGGGNADLGVASVVTTTPTGGDKLISTSESSATFTAKITNVAGADATGTRIRYRIPQYITGSTGVSTVTAVVGDINGAPNGSTATFSCTRVDADGTCTQTGGALRPGDYVTIVVTATRPLGNTFGGTASFTAQVDNSVEFDLNNANDIGSDVVTIDPIADVEMTGKTLNPATVLAGENATYVMSYRNNGPDASNDVGLSDTFSFFLADGTTANPTDPGLEVIAINSTRPGSSCSVAAGAIITPAAPTVTCVIGFMFPAETQSVTLTVRPLSQLANPTRVVRNSVTVSTTSVESPSGGTNGNNTQTATLTVLSNSIDLLVNKTDAVDPVPFQASGSTFIDYRVRVTSNGPSLGTNVRITESMTPPAGRRIRFVCDTTSFGGATCNAASLCSVTNVTSGVGVALAPFTCSVPAGNATTGPAVGELATGQSKDIFLRYEVLDQPPASGDVFNSSSSVTSDQNDTFLANNTQVELTTTRNRIDIRVTKAASLPTVSVGQAFNWIVTVTNNGPGHSLVTDLTDTLPTGSVITGPITWTRSLLAASGTCSAAGLTVTCALGRLDSTGVATITIPVRLDSFPTGGTASNSAVVDVDPAKTGADDFPGGNNTGTATVTVIRSSLAGTVFEDRDRAGANAGTPQLAAAEPRIAGVSIRLTGTDSFGNAVDRTTTTDGSGNFIFDDLAPSNGAGYALAQTQPAGYGNGPADPPSSGGSQPSAGGSYNRGGASGNSGYGAIVLGSNAAAVNYNFPELRQVSLSGFVYVDVNANNVRDAGTDTPISGATVRLLNAGTQALVASTATDAAGLYTFAGLDPLVVYTLEEPLPVTAGSLANGPINPGLIGGAACAAGCTAQANTPAPDTDRIAAIDLSAGVDGTLFNFGELQATAISGTVYIDRNTNNTLDPTPTDGRLAGVTLTLYAGGSCSGTPLATQITDASGAYSFGGLAAGQTYTVCQTQPVGYADGAVNPGTNATSPAANALTITNLPVGGSGGNHFAERLGSIAGSVYLDANHDGIRQVGESGIAGVTVTLTGTDAVAASVSRTAVTDSSGNYVFADVVGSAAGGYTLTQQAAQPVVTGITTLNGRTTAGTVAATPAGTATAVAATPSAISAIVLPAGGTSINNLFGEILPVSITGIVFSDANNNGIQNLPGDVGLGSVTITLTGTDDNGAPVSRTLSTAPDGSFSATGLRPGTYTLTQPTQPAGTANGQTVPGSAGGSATAQATTPSVISGIVLTTPGAASNDNRFAEIPDSGVIAGRVWTDANNDGVVDASETGIAGQTIQLSGTDSLGNGVARTVVTAADGSWSFSGLPLGTYTVTQPAQPAGTLNGRTVPGTAGGTATPSGSLPSVISAISLGAGQSSLNNNFGEILAAQLSGRVWLDANNDGAIGAGESGLGVVAIDLTGTNDLGASVSLSTSTAADGSYSFAGLRPGTYTVTEPVQPTGTSNGRTVAGSAGGSVTPVGVTPSAISAIVLVAGQSGINNNFGELPAAQISGRVWTDGNNNGVIDSGETGIAGVALTLTGTSDLGASVSVSITTAADGTWSFTGLRPGTYTVTEPTQPSGTLNGSTVAGSAGGTATGVSTLPSAISGIVLIAGQTAAANNFGEILGAQLQGRVWADANNDGVIGAGESGIAGVSLVLTGTDDIGNAINVTRSTAADGSYSFTDLRPGTYTVTEPTQPPGTSNGLTVAGSAGGTATPVATTPSAISGAVLSAGLTATAYNFGEVPESADLLVSKTHTKLAFTVGLTGTYQISVRNGGSQPTSGSYTVQDRLPTGLTLNATPTGAGWTCTGAVGASSFSCSASSVIAAGAAGPGVINVVVNVGADAQPQSPVSNAVLVEGGGEVPARGPSAAERDNFLNNPTALPVCVSGVTHNACRDPVVVQLAAALSGTVWTDSGSAGRLLDAGDRRMPGWLVEVLEAGGGTIVGRATTSANGTYRVPGLEPGVPLSVRFRDPVSNVIFGYPVNGETAPGSSGASCVSGTPPAGQASSCVGTGANPQLTVVLVSGAELPQQSLPIDPSGVVYDTVLRTPVAGSVVTLSPSGVCTGWNPSTSVVAATLGGYTVAGNSISMTVGPDGFYQFLLAPAAPASCNFSVAVTPPAGYNFVSTLIPPTAGPLTPAGGAGAVFAVQPQAGPPTAAPGTATTYYLLLAAGSAAASIVHNHIPIDPSAIGALSLSKTGDRSVAEVGDSVRYTLTMTQANGGRPVQTSLVDRLPAGFTYIPGTATVNGVPIADPAGGLGPNLVFQLGPMPTSNQLVLRYRARVGVGAQQGDGINRAQAHACQVINGCVDAALTPLASAVSTNRAEFRVRVVGGVFTTDACVLGKVFIDCNNNHVQDREELGVPGVRLMLSDGTTLISDSEGKYSMCGLPPRSHVLRIDPSTLPRGSRLTTSSNRNLGDAGSLWLDLKNGELHRADFIEGSCSNTVLEQTKARRAQGEVRSVESEKKGGPALRFDSKAHELDTQRSPQQGTDGANQRAPKPRPVKPDAESPAKDESNLPTPDLPMNQPPPRGRTPGQPSNSAATGTPGQGGSNGSR